MKSSRIAGCTQHKIGSEGFSGTLHHFALLDVIQMACVARRDGRLRIRHRRENGEVVLSGGKIIHAATRQQAGEAALLEVLCWTEGDFEFLSLDPRQSPPHTISGGWEKVLMDAVRRRDEQQHLEIEGDSPPSANSKRDLLSESRLGVAKGDQRLQRTRVIRAIALFSVLVVSVGLVCWSFGTRKLRSNIWVSILEQKIQRVFRRDSNWQKQVPSEILIPAGTFFYQEWQPVDLPAFNIDSTEVTVWQYQEFLDAVGDDTRYDHPNQRTGKQHLNPSWRVYAKAAFSFAEFHGVRLNPNFPAVYLDWFDAYAFAKWKHRRLPTEMEWEKAGRGDDGRSYPWGNSFIVGAANLYRTESKLAGWSQAGQHKLDCSPYGVRDLAGNVSEWTASDDGKGSPIVRGGNFMTEDGQLTRRVTGLSPYTIDGRIGFRTAGD